MFVMCKFKLFEYNLQEKRMANVENEVAPCQFNYLKTNYLNFVATGVALKTTQMLAQTAIILTLLITLYQAIALHYNKSS